MAPSFEDIIQSSQFTFLIGEEKWPIIAHATAIAATSSSMNALINGGMNESETRQAEIRDVQVDDFVRFCEYAYRGDYSVPKCLQRENTSNNVLMIANVPSMDEVTTPGLDSEALPPPLAEEEPADPWGPATFGAPDSKEKKKKKKAKDSTSRGKLRSRFEKRNYLTDGDPKDAILEEFIPKSNFTIREDFTPVFLAHARLYAFASVRFVEPLKKLTLHKLQKTLINYKIYPEHVGDIMALVRFAYRDEDIPDRSEDGSINSLRRLVVEYVACEIDIIGKHPEFLELMEEGGEFVGDFWGLVTKYLI